MPVPGRLVAAAACLLLVAGCSADKAVLESSSPSSAPTASAGGQPSKAAQPRRGRAERPVGPGQAARQLVAADAVIASPTATSAELEAAAGQQQLTYREAGVRPGWDDRLLARLSPRLRASARHNIAARREFRSMHYTLSDTLPAWRIVEPASAAGLERFYRAAEAEYDVGWEYLAAINLVETAMGRIRGTSVAGARGPMQFMPSTWARWGRGDIDDPRDSIMAAARYLASNGFAGGPRGVYRALYAYNNHPAYVRGVTHYARVMEADPRAFLAYHRWDVYYLTTEGDVVLPVGYERTRPVPVRRYLEAHPQG